MDDLHKLQAHLLLNRIPGLGPQKIQSILQHFFSAADVFHASDKELHFLPEALRQEIHARQSPKHPDHESIEKELEYCQRQHIQLLSIENNAYPFLLKQCSSPPSVLYIQGDPLLLNEPQLAVVGARKASRAGVQTAYDWAAAISAHDVHICSGLAEGIDAAAHQGALAAGGKTIAVLAHGLDSIYPSKHKRLAESIIQNGALVSEFAIGMKAQREYFPRRNRIISGLSEAVLVVEAAIKSGTLITARYAIEQNREVFAVPGSPRDPIAEGCHWLIQQGAYLADSPTYICETMGWSGDIEKRAATNSSEPTFDKALLALLPFEFSHFDQLQQITGFDAQQLAVALLPLEMAGVIEKQGASYRRI